MDLTVRTEETQRSLDAVTIFEGFSSYDMMDVFMEADVEVPRGERFYDPVYEEIWGQAIKPKGLHPQNTWYCQELQKKKDKGYKKLQPLIFALYKLFFNESTAKYPSASAK